MFDVTPPRRPVFLAWISCALLAGLLAGCTDSTTSTTGSGSDSATSSTAPGGEKVLQLPMRSAGPRTFDPTLGSSVYDNRAIGCVYETLLQYKYLKRPLELEPLLLESMPERSADGLLWKFKLKDNVFFHDDACFADGKGRKVVSKDVFNSWRRLADPAQELRNWWLVEDLIEGFDEYKDTQGSKVAAGGKFDYDAPVAGFITVNDREFHVRLKKPVVRFEWTLAMFQLSVVPLEAAQKYGDKLGLHPVGTGPFILKEEADWQKGVKITFHRNPNYHHCVYPSEHMPEDVPFGFHEPAGTKLPIADKIVITMYQQDQPMWLKFLAMETGYTQVPAENFGEAFLKRKRTLRDEYAEEGRVAHAIKLLDFIFRGFNMEDAILGGFDEKRRKLRKAITMAIDLPEFNDSFYNGINKVYDGVIPPGLHGYPPDGRSPKATPGPNLEEARKLLAEAGYPNGEGLPPIEYYSSSGANIPEQAEMLERQLAKVGIKFNKHLVEFPTLTSFMDQKKAQMFGYAWSSDYPDGENNLALFYGPNESPGINHFNYKNPKYDELYRKILVTPPSPARTKILEEMQEILWHDQPYVGSMARTRYYVVNPWLKNFKPTEDFGNWYKYLDLDPTKLPRR
ncbi:MAG: ABC transporter substrate-binding protein [Planctomycetota bacterium]